MSIAILIVFLIIFFNLNKQSKIKSSQKKRYSSESSTSAAAASAAIDQHNIIQKNRIRRKEQETIASDHEICHHVTFSGNLSDFEDRKHDWLARQMEEERRALYRMNF